MDGKERLAEIEALLREEPEETTTAILDLLKEHYGGVGFLMRTLAAEKPASFIRYALDAERLLGVPRALDHKTAELVALASATSLLCEHCIKAHLNGARTNGASWEEILDTILIAAHTNESSALSVALRAFKQEKARNSHAHEVEE